MITIITISSADLQTSIESINDLIYMSLRVHMYEDSTTQTYQRDQTRTPVLSRK